MVRKRRCPKLGLALGAGGARGLAHIGVLKVLQREGIRPAYLAGTSMGAVVAALYAAGHSPEEIERLAKTTDWRKVADFAIPKTGLIEGERAERALRNMLLGKQFHQLGIPLKVAAYNLSSRKMALFSRGDVARAVRASISIPGIFSPLKIAGELYIDGAVAVPTPFKVVREMGAEAVAAVDLYCCEERQEGRRGSRLEKRDGKLLSHAVRRKAFFELMREEFIVMELLNVRNYLFPERWPGFARRLGRWGFDLLLSSRRVLRIMARRELPPITKVMYQTVQVLTNNLAQERLRHAEKHGEVEVLISPDFGGLSWSDFDRVDEMVRIGEKAMEKKLPALRRVLAKGRGVK